MACIAIFHKRVPDIQQLKRTFRTYDFDCNGRLCKLNVGNSWFVIVCNLIIEAYS